MKIKTNVKSNLSVQWHITSKCLNNCRHCYMFESERYEEELANQLKLPQMIQILDDIEDFEEKWNFCVNNFFITGGDPLLCEDYKEFLKELRDRNKNIYMMGNPETLTEENLTFLKEIGVIQFQMSLDGLQDTHDYYRGKGSFNRTVKALQLLKDYDIKGTIMFTLTGENIDELIPLLYYVASNTEARGFAFDLVCGVGNAKEIDSPLDKYKLKEIFEEYLEAKEKIKNSTNTIRLAEKPKFFQLLHYDRDDYYPYDFEEFDAVSGCYVGYTCYTILSDGSVSACRRFPAIIGKMPQQKIEDIFLKNQMLKKFRRADSFKKCKRCKFYKFCRGCAAVTYGYTENPFDENPLCFVDLLDKKDVYIDNNSENIDLPAEDEVKLIRSLLSNQFAHDYNDFMEDEEVLILIGGLLNNSQERKIFFSNPDQYIKSNDIKISKKYLAYICYYIDQILRDKIGNPIKYAFETLL